MLFFVVVGCCLFICSFVVVFFWGVLVVKVCLFILVVVFLLAFVPIQSDGQLCPQVWKISRIFHCCFAGRGWQCFRILGCVCRWGGGGGGRERRDVI